MVLEMDKAYLERRAKVKETEQQSKSIRMNIKQYIEPKLPEINDQEKTFY
jgi:hypothetical protein